MTPASRSAGNKEFPAILGIHGETPDEPRMNGVRIRLTRLDRDRARDLNSDQWLETLTPRPPPHLGKKTGHRDVVLEKSRTHPGLRQTTEQSNVRGSMSRATNVRAAWPGMSMYCSAT